ncbi:sensor histidine kinase [Sandaracinus amylolyticus]|uniref:histidine kinase n=1 Tax=Sandaracinus amylolyticus TaxID=927083 RepID=A0A0F6YGY9_9BACT|nr:GAF domain-containing sensor histidine kinase [Sandaracinus amylolyticus]AKF05241.1 signal transduction histidine kinase, nitrogen specific, NtrB [Sandaracinus amylolyticus]
MEEPATHAGPETTSEASRRLDEARLRLVHLDAEGASSLAAKLARIARIAARCLAVERVSIWMFSSEHGGGLRALEIFDPRAPEDDIRWISAQSLGAYARMLCDRRVIAAHRVREDDATHHLVDGYFAPLEISATVEAPIYRDGVVVGVVCHEHRGPARTWTAEEADFAVSVAEVVALELATADLREAHEALRRQEVAMHDAMRDEAIARLARGVAHDVNNLLAVVVSAAALLRRNARGDAPPAEAEVIEEAANSAARLVRDLLEVGRAASTDRGDCELDEALHDAVPSLRGIASERRLAIIPDAPGWIVPLSMVRLEQVLLNLVANACDATRAGGRIEVRTLVVAPGRVAIEIEDDGTGIGPGVMPHLFEPYFSTKSAGRGLGLPTVLAIVRGARGAIDIAPAPGGRGTIARVELPAKAPTR